MDAINEKPARVGGFGSPNVHWLKVTIDTKRRDVFVFEQMIVADN